LKIKIHKILQLAKNSIEEYNLREAKLYLDILDSKYVVDKNIMNYLWAKYFIANNDFNKAEKLLQNIHTGPFNNQSKYLISKIKFSKGDFNDGDDFFKFRLTRGEKIDRKLYLEDKIQSPLWNFEKNTKVLIWQDFALGETILLLRILSLINIDTCDITILIDPRLIPLFENNFQNLKFVDYNYPIETNNYDYHLPIGSLIEFFKKNNFEKFNFEPLKLKKSYKKNNDNICLFFSGEGNKDNKHKRISDLMVIELLNPLKDNFSFTLINRNNHLDYFARLLDRNNFNFSYPSSNIYNDFENLAEIFLSSRASIMTSCSEAYISASVGTKTVLLYNQNFPSHWMWHNSDKNMKNKWFSDMYTLKFYWDEKNCILKDKKRIKDILLC